MLTLSDGDSHRSPLPLHPLLSFTDSLYEEEHLEDVVDEDDDVEDEEDDLEDEEDEEEEREESSLPHLLPPLEFGDTRELLPRESLACVIVGGVVGVVGVGVEGGRGDGGVGDLRLFGDSLHSSLEAELSVL
nr:hypothetical protein [Phocid alphaherpesvirus 1]